MNEASPNALPIDGVTSPVRAGGSLEDAASTKPSLQRPRFGLFDSMRAVAVLCVLGMHVGYVSGGSQRAWYGFLTSHLNVGVTIFFVISGFLLYRPHAVALLSGIPSPPLATYVRRRIVRIVPAYWVALTLLAIWPGLYGVFTHDWWIYYGFAQGYSSDWQTLTGGIGPAWSLTVEVGFYAALPGLAWALRRLCRSPGPHRALSSQLWGLAVFGVLGEILRNAFSPTFPALPTTYPGLLLDFSVGMFLAVLSASVGADERDRSWTRWVAAHSGVCWVLAGAVYLSVCVVLPRGITKETGLYFSFRHLAYVTVAALLILPAVFGEHAGGVPRRLLGTRAMAWLGKISYGVFLWHLPLLFALARVGVDQWIPDAPFLSLALAILPISLVCGAASFHLVEQPAMRLRGSSLLANRAEARSGPSS